MCCGSNDTVIPINCSTVSPLTPLTPLTLSSQLSEYSDIALITSSLSVVTPPVSSVPLETLLLLTHTLHYIYYQCSLYHH